MRSSQFRSRLLSSPSPPPSPLSSSSSSSSMAGIVVVFDFDKTIIDCDSDNWVVDSLGATRRFNELLQSLPWNSAVDQMMSELHSEGRTIEEIAENLRSAPLFPPTIEAIKAASALGCELRIVSDANFFFIETILKHHGLFCYFTEINTNLSYVDDEGRLRISPYHDFTTSPHGCGSIFCPPNMCKGKVMERMRTSASAEGKKQFIYLGDGKGDYCPSLKLREGDCVMPRKNYPLWELISSDTEAVQAEIHEWSDAEELKRVLLRLIQRPALADWGEVAKSPLDDFKCLAAPLPPHDALPAPLPVPN